MKKIIVFGNQKISIECIKILKKRKDVDLLAVVGCEKPQDKILGYPSLKKFCDSNSIRFYNPERLDDAFYELVKNMHPDICFSIFYRNIFKEKFIDLPKMGFINIHPSLLPKYRGPVPTLWALLNGEEKAGVTIHYIDKGVDTGDIIGQIVYEIPQSVTGFELHNILMDKATALFKKELPSILKGINSRVKQVHAHATYFGKYTDSLRKINWHFSVEKITNTTRAFTKPYSGALASISNKNMILWKSRKTQIKNYPLSGPGKIVKVFADKRFIVSGVNGLLLIEEYEIDGGKRTEYDAYIRVGNKFVNT